MFVPYSLTLSPLSSAPEHPRDRLDLHKPIPLRRRRDPTLSILIPSIDVKRRLVAVRFARVREAELVRWVLALRLDLRQHLWQIPVRGQNR